MARLATRPLRAVFVVGVLTCLVGLAGGATGAAQPGASAVAIPMAGPAPVGQWSTTGDLAVTMSGPVSELLPDGRVLLAGGGGTAAQVYDPKTGGWTQVGPFSHHRDNLARSVLLRDGTVLVAGGTDESGTPVQSVELFNAAQGSWRETGGLAGAHQGMALVLLRDGRALATGGAFPPSTAVEVYDPVAGSWSPTGALGTERYLPAAATLRDGRVLVAGGAGPDDLATAEIYDPATGRWSTTAPMAEARQWATATLLVDGRVLVVGGHEEERGCLSSAEIFDPAGGKWTTAASTSAGRCNHTATLLRDGSVLVAGGTSGVFGAVIASAERYVPSRNAWLPAGSLAVGRYAHAASALANGDVLVAGGTAFNGTDEFSTPESEIFHPLPLTSAPSVALISPATERATAASVRVSWSTTESLSSVAQFELGQSMDGGSYAAVPLPAPLTTRLARYVDYGHIVRYRARVVGRNGDVGRWEYGAPFMVTMDRAPDAEVSYVGRWLTATDSAALGGATAYATAAGAQATLRFVGSGVAWVAATGSSRGTADVFVDGRLATTVNLAGTARNRQAVFQQSWPASGPHTIAVVVKGTTGPSRVDVDSFIVLHNAASNAGVPGALEAETMAIRLIAGTILPDLQDMTPFGPTRWSAGWQMVWPAQPDGAISLAFEVTTPGRYALSFYGTRGPDSGIVTISIGGQVIEPGLDLYGPSVQPTGRLPLAVLDLVAGDVVVEFDAVGRNPLSTGYAVGIDTLLLQPII